MFVSHNFSFFFFSFVVMFISNIWCFIISLSYSSEINHLRENYVLDPVCHDSLMFILPIKLLISFLIFCLVWRALWLITVQGVFRNRVNRDWNKYPFLSWDLHQFNTSHTTGFRIDWYGRKISMYYSWRGMHIMKVLFFQYPSTIDEHLWSVLTDLQRE